MFCSLCLPGRKLFNNGNGLIDSLRSHTWLFKPANKKEVISKEFCINDANRLNLVDIFTKFGTKFTPSLIAIAKCKGNWTTYKDEYFPEVAENADKSNIQRNYTQKYCKTFQHKYFKLVWQTRIWYKKLGNCRKNFPF